jgi:uncharacterized protein YecT (DUF1311 family)
MRLNIALVGLCAMLLLSACARDPETTQETPAAAENTPAEPCDDAPDQRAMTACWGNESRKEQALVDAALKKLDAIVVAKAMPAAQQQLQEDQRRWQEFVEGHCGLYGALYDGGSAGPMTVAVCRWQLAQSRLQQLTDLTAELDR